MKVASTLLALYLGISFVASYPADARSAKAGRIVNGTDTSIGEFPYIASVQIGTAHVCSGFIYSDLHILTSASCVYQRVPSELHIVVGITSLIDYSSYAQTVEVVSIEVHADYDPVNKVNDIAILKLAGPLLFTSGVQVGYYDEVNFSSRTGVTTGWGATLDGGIVTVNLRKTTLELLDPSHCLFYGANQYDPNYMICAGSETSSPCTYDEGSPLAQNGVIVGIMSHNKGCLSPYAPTLFTRLSAYYDWLLSVAGLQPTRPSTVTVPTTATESTEPATSTTTEVTTTKFEIPTAPCVNCPPPDKYSAQL